MGIAWRWGVVGRRSAMIVAMAAAMLVPATAARAQQTRNIALPRFEPAPAGDLFFGVPSPATPGMAVLRGGVLLDYAHNPLILTDENDKTVGHVVEHQLLLHLNVALVLFERLQVSADLPFAVVNK